MNTIEVKYTVTNNSIHAKELKLSTSGSARYNLFAGKTLFPHRVTPVMIELKNGNSSWLFW